MTETIERKKILMLCDHPLIPSGVGTQARYLIEGLLATGKYKFYVFGGAMKHPNYDIISVSPEKFGEGNWIIRPVDGFGDRDKLREVLEQEKPDALFLFTDPRQFVWVWEMEDEVRSYCPIVYWHVWDNDPIPRFNKVYYDSTDFISCLSLKTYGILQSMGQENFNYIPHAVDPEVFKPLSSEEREKFRRENMGPHADKKFIVFWNNRNARRKMTGDVLAAFSIFADKVGRENVALAMHTLVGDPEGQNIVEVAKVYNVEKNLIISQNRVDAHVLNGFYNSCDCTLNISNAEGFGLSTLESMMAGRPIVAMMTGGLQFQLGDWYKDLTDFSDQKKMHEIALHAWNRKMGTWTGIPIFPTVRSCTGSQPIPYIYEDRASNESIAAALEKLYRMPSAERDVMGSTASRWARKQFSLNSMISSWDSLLERQILKSKENIGQRLHVANL